MKIRKKIKDFIKNNSDAERARILKAQISTAHEIKGVNYKLIEKFAIELANESVEIAELPLDCYEEVLLAGLVIAYSNISAKEKVELLGKITPCFDNWATGDFLVPRLKGLESEVKFFERLLTDENPFIARFAIVWFKKYELKKNVKKVVKLLNETISSKHLYVEMALAWTYLEALLLDYDFMKDYLVKIKRVTVRNRVLEKACDAERLPLDKKKEILELRSKLLNIKIEVFRQSKDILKADK